MLDRLREEVMVVQGFSCMTGQRTAIVRNLSFLLREGERLLLVGASGVGKSSLLRALRGLWPYSADWVSMTDQVCLLNSDRSAVLGMCQIDIGFHPFPLSVARLAGLSRRAEWRLVSEDTGRQMILTGPTFPTRTRMQSTATQIFPLL